MEIGTLTLDNVIMKEKITEIYPEILAAVKTVVIVLLISLWIFITLIHLVLSFFWALVVWLVSMISGSRHLSYEESLRFVWILYPIVMIA